MRILAKMQYFKEFFDKISLTIDKGDDFGLKIKNIQYNLIQYNLIQQKIPV
ncbi:MAG: hypothetical protein ABIJ91_04395 [Candidatus Kuenenbacteria bacterium]